MQMAQEVPRNLEQCRVGMLPTLVQPEAEARIVTGQERGFTVVLDFGEIVSGRVGFALDGPAGAVVDFTYGERWKLTDAYA